MKKKLVIIWVYVFSLVVLVVPAFAQPGRQGLRDSLVKGGTYSNNHVQIANIVGGGPPIVVTMPNGTKKNASVGMNLHDAKSIKIGSSQYVDMLVWNDTQWYKPSENRNLVVLHPGTTVTFNRVKETTRWTGDGKILLDTGFKALAELDEMLTFLSSVNTAAIEKQVAGWKKGRNNEQLASHIISQKSQKAGFLGAIVGLGPTIIAPAEYAHTLAQWLIQAEMAYALACAYGTPPIGDRFKNDLYILFAGEVDVKKVLKDKAFGVKPGESVGEKWARSAGSNLMGNLVGKLKKLLQDKAKSKIAKGILGLPVVGAAKDGITNAKDATTFGNWAKKYYSNTIKM
ncbi:MAG: hypothetical protein LBB91_01980 [Clostridiales bacterium]|jgi:hypothetical protein|nr:hypothetical protein [Clostridiales bacterium]